MHVVDSALSATYERLASRKANIGHIYYRNADGSFTEAVTPDQLPGLRWFFETQEYGGAEYWMKSDYIGKKDMRLIRPHWLFADLQGGRTGVSVEYAGAMVTKVTRDDQSVRVDTRNLQLADGSAPRVALVTGKKGTKLTDSSGKALSGVPRCEYGSMILLLTSQDGSLYGYKNGTFGYVKAEDVEVLAPAAEGFRTGMISVNGKTSGSTEITAHKNPKASSVAVTKWKPGTPVAVVEESEEFLLLEGKGYRGDEISQGPEQVHYFFGYGLAIFPADADHAFADGDSYRGHHPEQLIFPAAFFQHLPHVVQGNAGHQADDGFAVEVRFPDLRQHFPGILRLDHQDDDIRFCGQFLFVRGDFHPGIFLFLCFQGFFAPGIQDDLLLFHAAFCQAGHQGLPQVPGSDDSDLHPVSPSGKHLPGGRCFFVLCFVFVWISQM